MSDDKHIDDPDGALIDLSEPPAASDDASGTAVPQQPESTPESTAESAQEATVEPTQEIIPQSPLPVAAPAHEARATPRYRVRWRTEVVLNAQTTYYGHLKDISISGAAVLMEHNIKSAQSITLFVEIPSESTYTYKEPHILQVEGKVISTIYESESAYFRTGIVFRRFIPENDRAFLDNYLKNNCIELPPL